MSSYPSSTPARQSLCPAAVLLISWLFLLSQGVQAAAQSRRSTPLVHISAGSEPGEGETNALLVGAVSGSQWIEDKKVHGSLKSGQVYRFYSLTGFVEQAAGGKPLLGEASGAAWYIPFKGIKTSKESLLGIAGAWNALPRRIKSESVTQPVYLNVVAEVLKQKGLTKAKPHISKIVRVDLEGKGQESVIIEASSPGLYENPFAETTLKPGAYCFIIARTLVNGKVKTLILGGDYNGNKRGSQGANVVRLSHVLDLNGSGLMEIVIAWNYYEGGGVDVYRLKNGKARIILSASDGA